MLLLKSKKNIRNKAVSEQVLAELVRQKFIDIYKSKTGNLPSRDFVLTVSARSGKLTVALELDMGKEQKPLMPYITGSEFRNEVHEDEFFNRKNAESQQGMFKESLDELMGELPSLIKKSQEEQ